VSEWEKIYDWKASDQPDPDSFQYAAGFLLAGGASTRMGQNKALLVFEGETLAERALRKLREICPEVAIAGGSPELDRFGRLIPDAFPGCGPLGGIVTALQQSASDWNLFLPVDMPFIPGEALRMMLQMGSCGEGLVAVPQVAGRIHPLCGAYSRRTLPVLQAQLKAGRLKMKQAIEATGSFCYMQWDHKPEWFLNVNTPQEFAALSRPVSWIEKIRRAVGKLS
jgi:molybdopterin-guanine dinucleotide biosynthesis protein A